MQVLSIGETVEEVSDSGFLGPVPTLQVQLLVDDSLLQVCINFKLPCEATAEPEKLSFSGLALHRVPPRHS